MPVVAPTSLGDAFAQAAMAIHHVLHPLTLLLERLGFRVPGDVDLAAWAMLAWLLGSREAETARRLGFLLATWLLALAAVEAALAG